MNTRRKKNQKSLKKRFKKVTLAKSAGFCVGVKRALKIARETAQSRNRVYMLGNIVHNEQVVKNIIRAGVKKITKLGAGNGKTLLIRAHGASHKTISQALLRGYVIVDATCPMVKEIHKIAKSMQNRNYKIIVIGDEKHDEVKGIVGQLEKKALVIEKRNDVTRKMRRPIKKAAIVVQSTQDIKKVEQIVERIKPFVDELKFFNTICKPTTEKQEDIRKLPLLNEVMIVIGSKASANTRRLFEISRELNPHTFWVQSKRNLKSIWFRNVKKVGVTAGASTPDSITKGVINQIRRYS